MTNDPSVRSNTSFTYKLQLNCALFSAIYVGRQDQTSDVDEIGSDISWAHHLVSWFTCSSRFLHCDCLLTTTRTPNALASLPLHLTHFRNTFRHGKADKWVDIEWRKCARFQQFQHECCNRRDANPGRNYWLHSTATSGSRRPSFARDAAHNRWHPNR